MKWLSYVVVALIALGTGWYVGGLDMHQHDARADLPQPAPAFALTDLNNRSWRNEDFDGQLLLINFWATWCAPCLKEIPLLKEFHAAHQDEGFTVIGPALDDTTAVAGFVDKMQINYPIMVGDQTLFGLMDALGDTLGALPFSVLINREGQLVERHWGELHREDLQSWLDRHL